MKKITVLVVLLFLVFLVSPVYAKKDDDRGNSSKKNVMMQEDGEDDGEDGEDDDAMSSSEAAKKRNTIRKLNRIMEEVEDPEVEEEVEEVAEDQEEVEEVAEEAAEEIENRGQLIKFVAGPDYKNLGQLRKQVVHTRNNIRKLERIKEKVSDEDDQLLFDSAISTFKVKETEMQAEIAARSSGFSLFGWLSRWLSSYDDLEVPEEPEPTGEPVVSPEVTPGDLSPTETETPITTTPTEEPVVSPEVTP